MDIMLGVRRQMNDETNREHTQYNEAKTEILDAIKTLGQATAKEISLITHRTPEAASMCLLRYHGQGLLNRHTLKGRTKAYTLTTRGQERLNWLKSKAE
ncbi:MAG: hypothetical protein K940chlam2_01437 [Chlamydiae bacterium]|nr:hypothetical protein [Chlamydiota bacterium]